MVIEAVIKDIPSSSASIVIKRERQLGYLLLTPSFSIVSPPGC